MSTIDDYRNGERPGETFQGSYLSQSASPHSKAAAHAPRRASFDIDSELELDNDDDDNNNLLLRGSYKETHHVAEILMRKTATSSIHPWHPKMRQSTSTSSLNNRKAGTMHHRRRNLHYQLQRSVTSLSSSSSRSSNSSPFLQRLPPVTAIGGAKQLQRTSLAPAGRSALFTKPQNGLHSYLRSHNLIKEDVHSLHLNNFSNGNVQRVLDEDNESVLLSVVAKCRRLRTLEVAGMGVSVKDALIVNLPKLSPLLCVLDISQTQVTALRLLQCIKKLPLLSTLTCQNCPHLFKDTPKARLLLQKLLIHGALRVVDISNNMELNDETWIDSSVNNVDNVVVAITTVCQEFAKTDGGGDDGDIVGGDSIECRVGGGSCGRSGSGSGSVKWKGERIVKWTSFDVSYNENMTDVSMVRILRRMPFLETCRMLSMPQSTLTDQVLRTISETSFKSLTKLDISGCSQFKGHGLESVVQSCTKLRSLSVSGLHPAVGFSSSCLHHLTHLPQLSVLDVAGNKGLITAKFLFALLDRCKTIRCINLTGVSAVNLDMVLQMQRLCENLVVTWRAPPPERPPLRQFVATVKPDGKKKKGKGKKKGKKKKK